MKSMWSINNCYALYELDNYKILAIRFATICDIDTRIIYAIYEDDHGLHKIKFSKKTGWEWYHHPKMSKKLYLSKRPIIIKGRLEKDERKRQK